MTSFRSALCAFALFVHAGLTAHAAVKGSYVLIDQGVNGNQSFAALGLLTLDGAGNVTGTEVVSMANASAEATVTGTYTMASESAGTMVLSAVPVSDTSAEPAVQTYRFLVTDDNELFAVRTDRGVLSTAQLLFADAAPGRGPLVLHELDRHANGQFSALLASLALDGNGAVTGDATVLTSGEPQGAKLSGSYSMPDKALGTLTVNVTTTDEDGNALVTAQHYRVATTRDGLRAIRVDPGRVTVASAEKQ